MYSHLIFVKLKYFVLFANLAVSGCFSHCRETNEWPTDQRLQEGAVFQLKAYGEKYVAGNEQDFYKSFSYSGINICAISKPVTNLIELHHNEKMENLV